MARFFVECDSIAGGFIAGGFVFFLFHGAPLYPNYCKMQISAA
jgi:hypothetical protein